MVIVGKLVVKQNLDSNEPAEARNNAVYNYPAFRCSKHHPIEYFWVTRGEAD